MGNIITFVSKVLVECPAVGTGTAGLMPQYWTANITELKTSVGYSVVGKCYLRRQVKAEPVIGIEFSADHHILIMNNGKLKPESPPCCRLDHAELEIAPN